MHAYKDAFLILDPPYLSTNVNSYKKANYWKLTDYLDTLKACEGRDFVYFTSSKSQLCELCDWMRMNAGYNPLGKAERLGLYTTVNGSAATKSIETDGKMYDYEDIMLFSVNKETKATK